MVLRLVGAVVLAVLAPAVAQANCSQKLDGLMSHMRDTDTLTSKYNQVKTRIERRGRTAALVAQECRIARQLEPRLASQLAELKGTGCAKDPKIGAMLGDIVRGHEDDLTSTRQSLVADCR